MQTKTKAGIVGFGMAGRNMHYRALVESLDDIVDVVAVYTRRPIAREGANKDDFTVKESVTLYNDIDEFLGHPGMKTVHITTPSGLHRDFILKAAEATGAPVVLIPGTRMLVRLLEGRRPGSWEETSIKIKGLYSFLSERHTVTEEFTGA